MTGTFVNGQNVITGIAGGLPNVGDAISATGYTQAGTVVQFILSGSSLVMSKLALASGTGITLTTSSAPLEGSGQISYQYAASGNLTPVSASAAPNTNLMGIASFAYRATGNLTGHIDGKGSAAYGYITQGFLSSPTQGLTVRDVVQDILLLWGIEQPTLAFPYLLRRAIHDLNGAMQMIWAGAKDVDYFSRQTFTTTFPATTTQMALPQTTIAALGPARIAATGQSLKVLSSRGQYDNFGPIYLGSQAMAVPVGVPMAFFLERLNQANPDNVKAWLHIVPAPNVDTAISIDISVEAPRYQYSDYTDATPIEMFHLYADSVLLPFARYNAMSSPYFLNPDRIPTLVANYQAAMRIIGAVDPALKEVDFSQRGSGSVKEVAA